MEQKKISETRLAELICERLVFLGIGQRYLQANIEKCRVQKEIREYLARLPENAIAGKGLIIVGPVGVGKTCTLIVLLRNILRSSATVEYAIYADGKRAPTGNILLTTSQFATSNKIFNAVFRKENQFLQELQTTAFLFIDDFGREYYTDYAFSTFEELIDYRYANKLPTFVTTNLTTSALRENNKFARVVDRWRECCDTIQIPGESMRE